MTSDVGPANLAFDFAEKGAKPLTEDLAGPRDRWPSPRLLLDVREVGEALGCGKTYVYELIARGELPTVKLGRLTRIPAFALAEFVGRKLGSNPNNPLLGQPFRRAVPSERGAPHARSARHRRTVGAARWTEALNAAQRHEGSWVGDDRHRPVRCLRPARQRAAG